MKKILLIVIVFAMLAVSTGSASIKLVRLTIINKSGYDASVFLIEKYSNGWSTDQNSPYVANYYVPQYYLTIPAGDRDIPTERVFTIFPTVYAAEFSYLQNGLNIFTTPAEEIDIQHNVQFPLLPPAKSGVVLCHDQYEDNNALLKQCLEDLVALRGFGEGFYKFLPTFWLR